MPGTDMPLEALKSYTGSWPCPEDFIEFWSEVKSSMDTASVSPRLERIESANPHAEYYYATIEAPDGSLLRAKYIRPVLEGPSPCVIQFHDYPGSSRGWFYLGRYAAIGSAVLAPECRGQGGGSLCASPWDGPLAYGPMFNGLEGEIRDMYLYQIIRDALLWSEAALKLEHPSLSVYGEGQGGGLAIACAAMYPEFEKCAAHYPLLCDYRRVWDKDFDTGPYESLRFFCRWHDPLGQRQQEIFDKLAYVDVKNFAPMVKSEVLMSTGLQDAVSPPSAQFAVFNALGTDRKCHLVYPKHGHELNNFFENELLSFLI